MKSILIINIVLLSIVGFFNNSSYAFNIEVYNAQNLLSEKGYDVGTCDGIFGNNTKKALEKYQNNGKLPITGKLDSKTLNELSIDMSLSGFQGIKFGTSFDKTVSKIKNIDNNLEGKIEPELQDHKKYFIVHGYAIGKTFCRLIFDFDKKQRFYRFIIQSYISYEPNEFNSSLKDSYNYFTKIFKNKYGKPSDCVEFPKFYEIENRTGYRICRWVKEHIIASTGISTNYLDYLHPGSKYVVENEVGNKFLFIEEMKRKEKSENKLIKDSAKDF